MWYKILYNPLLNKIYRNLIRFFAPNWKWKSKIPINGKVNIRTDKGTLIIYTNPTSFATKHIFWDGLDKFEYVPIYKKLITKLNVFIDIGANTGIYSTLGCLYNPNLSVLAFEPSEGPYEYLQRNIKINRLQNNIKSYKIALANENGEADFHEVEHNKYHFLDYNLGGVGNLMGKISHRKMKSTKVEIMRLDDFLENVHPNFKPEIIKIDTEATEHLVLAGMEQTINRHRPIIICETLFNRIEKKIELFFENRNYIFYNYSAVENRLKFTESLIRSEDNGVRDCFIVPKEKIMLIKEYL